LSNCDGIIRRFHESQLASGTLRPYWAGSCPASFDAEAELPAWRIHSRRTSSGREVKTFYGPLGEYTRSRALAKQLAKLYPLPAHILAAPLADHISPLAGTPSPLLSNPSPLLSNPSPLLSNPSPMAGHGSFGERITQHAGRLSPHAVLSSTSAYSIKKISNQVPEVD